MNDCWSPFITEGLRVEVPSPTTGPSLDGKARNWVAHVRRVAGYKVLLRYELMKNSSNDFWVNLLCGDIFQVEHSVKNGISLSPPKVVEDCNAKLTSDAVQLRRALTSSISGHHTLSRNFQEMVMGSLKNQFKEGMLVEVVDCNRLSSVRPAIVTQVNGKRLKIVYGENDVEVNSAKNKNDSDDDNDSNQFWVHERSPLLHYVGWAEKIGHTISASTAYISRCKTLIRESGTYTENEAAPDKFYEPPVLENDGLVKFETGQKLEARDPLNLSKIVVATVDKVLEKGYMMVKFDGTSDTFCYHKSSPYIFHAMFCHKMGIKLTPPATSLGSSNDEDSFKWDEYLQKSDTSAAPVALFDREEVTHGFRKGQKLEVTDLMNPGLICVATVDDIKGRLLRINFDGWGDDIGQWVDCTSPDLYPIGYCEAVGYKLEAPNEPEDVAVTTASSSGQMHQRGSNDLKTNARDLKKKTEKLSIGVASSTSVA